MITKYLEVGRNRWGILLNYDFGAEDHHDMAAVMYSFGMSDKAIRKALDVLSDMNAGMAISNDDLRMTGIYISDATSESQWWSTLNHELFHATTAIIDYYGEPYDEEPAAYLHGELMRLVVENVAAPCR